jgi:hypothetical protein
MIRENSQQYVSEFKVLVQKQKKAVDLYSTSKTESFCLAYLVRKECLVFLKAHSIGSTDFFEIKDSEKMIFDNNGCNSFKELSDTDSKLTNAFDAMNPKSLNNISITIQ